MRRIFWIALTTVLAAGPAWAQQGTAPETRPKQAAIAHPGFARHALTLKHEFEAFTFADLSGNGLSDLVVVEAERLQREPALFVSVFLQSAEGFRRVGEPQRLPATVSLLGAGRFDGQPGLALLLPDALEVWPWVDGTFARQAASRMPVQSVFPVPAGEVIQDMNWLADLNGDGSQELIVPRFDGLAVCSMEPGWRLRALGRMAVRPRTRYWRGLTYNAVAHDVPTLFYQDLDGNGWQDVIAFADDQLWVFPVGTPRTRALDGEAEEEPVPPWLFHDLAPPKPFDPKEPYDPPMRLVRAGDLNADGTLDLVISKNAPTDSDFNSKSTTMVFLGRKNGDAPVSGYGETPDQLYPSEGFSLPIVLDYDNNGRMDLIQVNVEITFWNAMRAVVTRTVSAQAAFYLMGEKGLYPAAPDELESYAVNFSLSRFGHQPIATWGDFNGDGLPDMLLSSDKEELGIHWGRPGAFWDPDPSLTIQDRVPINQRRVHVVDLNGDRKHDIVLTYNRDDNRQMPDTLRRVTVLITQHQPPAAR